LIRSGPSTVDRAAMVVCERCTAAKHRRPVAPGGAGGGARRGSLDLELRCTTFSAVSTYAERGTRQAQPRDLGGGSGDI
jgi:hypothetical protein